MAEPNVDQLAINTIRFLAVDMVEAAQSGHPGAPLGQAPMAYLLWTRFLRHNPATAERWQELLEQAVPDFAGRKDWYTLLDVDINSSQLAADNASMGATTNKAALWERKTSDLGRQFLRFIDSPNQLTRLAD